MDPCVAPTSWAERPSVTNANPRMSAKRANCAGYSVTVRTPSSIRSAARAGKGIMIAPCPVKRAPLSLQTTIRGLVPPSTDATQSPTTTTARAMPRACVITEGAAARPNVRQEGIAARAKLVAGAVACNATTHQPHRFDRYQSQRRRFEARVGGQILRMDDYVCQRRARLTTSLQHTRYIDCECIYSIHQTGFRAMMAEAAPNGNNAEISTASAPSASSSCATLSGRPRALDRSAQVRVRLLFARHQRADERQYEAQPQPQHRAENSRRRKRI